MSQWRHQAFERFPEFRTELQEAKSPYAYWIELQFAFADACRKCDADLFTRIVDYADWCLDQPEGKTAEDDLGTCVYCCFLEHIPEIAPSVTSGKSGNSHVQKKWKISQHTLASDPDIRRLYADLLSRMPRMNNETTVRQ